MKVKSGKHVGAFVVNGSIVGYDEFKNHQKNVKWKYQHNTGIWLKEPEEMKKKELKRVSAYRVSDGSLFESDTEAMKEQAKIDFFDQFQSSPRFSNEPHPSDLFRWLDDNCDWLLSIVTRLDAIDQMEAERQIEGEDEDNDCQGI